MKILIRKGIIVDRNSSYHLKKMDVLVENGYIVEINENNIGVSGIDKIYEASNLHISIGWFDFSVHYKDPGTEWQESLDSFQKAAEKGGYTEIVGFPNTLPIVQTKESLAYFRDFSEKNIVKLHNFGAVTKACEGKDFTDMIDLHYNGAVGFSDGKYPIQSSDILLKTLQYLHPINAILINKAEDKYLGLFGQIHEGLESTKLGLKGIPSAAEEIMIQRDLKLLEYTGLQSELPILHFSTISSAESVNLIRKAKKKGLPVSCDIAAHNLAFTEKDMRTFNTNFKVKPPFRSENDVLALKEGLKDGTIDLIVSDHNALDSELKNLEFDLAEFGAIGLETTFSVINMYSDLNIEQIITLLTENPRKILRMEIPSIKVGERANLTLFDPSLSYVFEEKEIVSKSKNSPFIGEKLTGKALGILHNSLNS